MNAETCCPVTALQEFYGGPVWKAHGDTANATMIDPERWLGGVSRKKAFLNR